MKQLTIIFSFLLVSFCFAGDSGREGTHNKLSETDTMDVNVSVKSGSECDLLDSNIDGIGSTYTAGGGANGAGTNGREHDGADRDGVEDLYPQKDGVEDLLRTWATKGGEV